MAVEIVSTYDVIIQFQHSLLNSGYVIFQLIYTIHYSVMH